MTAHDHLAALLALVREAARDGAAAALAAHAVPAPSATPLLDKRGLACALLVSAATVTRMTAEGMPHIFAGASPRYSLNEVRAWLAERGRKGTQATPSKSEVIPGVRLLSRGGRGRS